jgi:hypothetical protein
MPIAARSVDMRRKKSAQRTLRRNRGIQRYTSSPSSQDRTAFEAVYRFAFATDDDDAAQLARRVNLTMMQVIGVPYGMKVEDSAERRNVQQRLRTWFEQIQSGQDRSVDGRDRFGGTLLVSEGIKGFTLGYVTVAPRLRPVMVSGWNCTALGRFWLDVRDRMLRLGPTLRLCEACRTLYVKRKGQRYCSKRCSQATRSARWYQKHHKRVLAKRRETYVRGVRQVHPRARVSYRSRVH